MVEEFCKALSASDSVSSQTNLRQSLMLVDLFIAPNLSARNSCFIASVVSITYVEEAGIAMQNHTNKNKIADHAIARMPSSAWYDSRVAPE